MKMHGYTSFADMCLKINESYYVIERFLKSMRIDFTEEIKMTVEVLEATLTRAFQKFETDKACW